MVCNTNTSNSSFLPDVPSAYICPLTLEIMTDPLMDRTGRSFERTAIVEWLTNKSPTCPMTRRPMKVTDLVSNNRLRAEIIEWRKRHGEDVDVDPSHDDVVFDEVNRALTNFRICDVEKCYRSPRNKFLRLFVPVIRTRR